MIGHIAGTDKFYSVHGRCRPFIRHCPHSKSPPFTVASGYIYSKNLPLSIPVFPGIVSSCYGVLLGDQLNQGLHRTDRLTEQVDPVNLTEGIAFVLKKTPIMFDFQHGI